MYPIRFPSIPAVSPLPSTAHHQARRQHPLHPLIFIVGLAAFLPSRQPSFSLRSSTAPEFKPCQRLRVVSRVSSRPSLASPHRRQALPPTSTTPSVGPPLTSATPCRDSSASSRLARLALHLGYASGMPLKRPRFPLKMDDCYLARRSSYC